MNIVFLCWKLILLRINPCKSRCSLHLPGPLPTPYLRPPGSWHRQRPYGCHGPSASCQRRALDWGWTAGKGMFLGPRYEYLQIQRGSLGLWKDVFLSGECRFYWSVPFRGSRLDEPGFMAWGISPRKTTNQWINWGHVKSGVVHLWVVQWKVPFRKTLSNPHDPELSRTFIWIIWIGKGPIPRRPFVQSSEIFQTWPAPRKPKPVMYHFVSPGELGYTGYSLFKGPAASQHCGSSQVQ